jgi:hypothetical protein
MGLFWDLIQQNQISKQQDRSASLDDRVARLEVEHRHTQELLQALLLRLEQAIGEDLNRDGKIG